VRFAYFMNLHLKSSIYHKLKISYIIRLVIIKCVKVREFNDTLSAIWWYKTLIKWTFKYLSQSIIYRDIAWWHGDFIWRHKDFPLRHGDSHWRH